MPSLKVKVNFMKSVQPKQLVEDVGWGASAAIPYLVLPTLFKMSGWAAWVTGVFSTWLLGSLFDIPQWRSGAWTVGGTHLFYAYDVFGKLFNSNVWRFDDPSTGAARNYQQGLYDTAPPMIQPGAEIMEMPDGSRVVSYPNNRLEEPEEIEAPSQPAQLEDFYQSGQSVPALVETSPYDLMGAM